MKTPELKHRNTPGGEWSLPEDGWHQVAPRGEFPHAPSGRVQVLDERALAAMAERFARETQATPAAGLRVDWDHFSYDASKPSEAAGWITALAPRADGLWARIRWTDTGESAVRHGRYRFLSPVWLAAEVEELGGGRVRPLRLDSVGLTNNPNLRGLRPLSNRETTARASLPACSPNKARNHMNENLMTALGLPGAASEAEAAQAAEALTNRATSAEERAAELAKANESLRAAQVELDLATHAARIQPDRREAVRRALLANRDDTLRLLESLIAPPAAAPAPVPPLHNRATAARPCVGAGVAAGDLANRQRSEVEAYRRRQGGTFSEAWAAVKAERPELFQ